MTSRPLWLDAANFAARAHQHDFRNDEQTPYVAHPVRVAMIIAVEFGFTDESILAAALLHDTIEDCDVDYDEILEQFGPEVAEYVAVMSKDMRMVEPERERAYDRQLADGPWQARLIKLADTYDNLVDAGTDQIRQSLMKKVLRVLELAKSDEQLAGARQKLKDLAEKVEARVSAR